MIGTLDTKLDEFSALADEVERQGGTPILLDSSGREADRPLPTKWRLVGRDEVAAVVGVTTEHISSLPRGEAIEVIRGGVRIITEELQRSGEIQAAICMGGAGTHVAGPAFAALPIGFPKLVVSPLASGARTFEPYVGLRDVAVLHSVVDILGVNVLTAQIFREAAGYIVGAALAADGREGLPSGPVIAVTVNGNTTAPVMRAKSALEAAGYEVVAFHANGVGGRALEDFIGSGQAIGVLDYTTTELAGHLVGGLMDAGDTRMETAGRMGLPQVLVPGCLDFITCGRWDDAAVEFPDRVMFLHNPELTLVRLTAGEMAVVGRDFARKVNTAVAPATVCVPLLGLSINDRVDGVFYDPVANAALLDAIRSELSPRHRLVEVEAHIQADEFADVVVSELLRLLAPPADPTREYSSAENAAAVQPT
jgi:uncharacterized protein (UPF0261 family)